MEKEHIAKFNSLVFHTLLPIVVSCFNVLAVVTLETFGRKQVDVKSILLGVAKNPLIIASALGIAANLSGLRGPEFAVLISMFATPTAARESSES